MPALRQYSREPATAWVVSAMMVVCLPEPRSCSRMQEPERAAHRSGRFQFRGSPARSSEHPAS